MGLLFFFLRRYIEKKLEGAEGDERARVAARIKRTQIEDELHHAYGRLLFWLYKAIVTQHHNGELEEAYKKLQAAEARKKELDREIIAAAENQQT